MRQGTQRGIRMLTLVFVLLPLAACAGGGSGAGGVLASWNESASRDAIVSFVERTTSPGSADFVPEAERIAVFDNDGTLWAEQPAYFQLMYAVDRVQKLADENPEWRTAEPFASAIKGDLRGVAASGEEGLVELVMASHAGLTTAEFDDAVDAWLDTARHPRTGRRYDEMTYAPMVELLGYLRANGFKTFIVSGGGIDMIRRFSERAYGIPPEQVVGSTIKAVYKQTPDGPVIERLPEIDFIDDKAGKPVAIQRFIGRRPIAAFGNSDGDLQMLQWTAAGEGASLCVLIRHTDAEREWAYDRDSHIGRLDEALDQAGERGWVVVDMAGDWATVFGEAGSR
ncbi:MAG: HAD family hydrolase [Planctomycetota bacterium]